jgi:hypothetical protein
MLIPLHGATVPSEPRPLHCRGLAITFSLQTLHSVGLLWRVDRLVTETPA